MDGTSILPLALACAYIVGFAVLVWQHRSKQLKSSRKRQAVCLLLEHNGMYLAIDRYSKSGIPGDMGFPGGKVELGESLHDALVREVLEETGLHIYGTPTPVFSSWDGEYETHTFVAVAYGFIYSSDEGAVSWVKPEALVSGSCTFAKYNRDVFASVGLKL